MKKEKILIFGKGQLGNAYKNYLISKGDDVIIAEADIRNINEVEQAIKKATPSVVMNLAAKTALDWCEEEKNRLETFEVNTMGADNIGNICAKKNIYFVHMSSGCIYHSDNLDQVYKESDLPSPRAFYSWTKVWAENLLNSRTKFEDLKVLILRPRQLISSELSTRNALIKLATYNKFINIPQSATVVEDLLDASYKMIKQRITGTINTVNSGLISPYRIAELVKEYLFPQMEFKEISNEELYRIVFAKRVATILDTSKLKILGLEMPNIEIRIIETLKILKEKLNTDEGIKILKTAGKETKEKFSLVR